MRIVEDPNLQAQLVGEAMSEAWVQASIIAGAMYMICSPLVRIVTQSLFFKLPPEAESVEQLDDGYDRNEDSVPASDDPVWGSKTDDELRAAASALADYTEEGEQNIRAELRHRDLPEPPPPIGTCPSCGRSFAAHQVGTACGQCERQLPSSLD